MTDWINEWINYKGIYRTAPATPGLIFGRFKIKKDIKIEWSVQKLSISNDKNCFSKHRPSGPMLFLSWFGHMCVCVSVCVLTFEVPFKRIFAPTFQSQMSKNFKDSESSGKIKGKKWSQIWKLFLIKGGKLTRKKRVSFWPNFAFLCWYQCFSLRLKVLWPPLPKVRCPSFLDIQNL